MTRRPPPSATSLCSLERKWRQNPENAALPRALRVLTQIVIPVVLRGIGVGVSVSLMISFVYGLLLIAWGVS